MCHPRQLFFLLCGPETPKGWTPLNSTEKENCFKEKKAESCLSDKEQQTF